jgi:hypothetical protein
VRVPGALLLSASRALDRGLEEPFPWNMTNISLLEARCNKTQPFLFGRCDKGRSFIGEVLYDSLDDRLL